ncbi:MAG: anti-sigma factor [Bacteroidetes bacterium]|nr:anti-sigma factor [Bacteroidota bacterium]
MTKEEIIASGLLELYVTGSLTAQEIETVEDAIKRDPSLVDEIETIEASFIHLSETVGTPVSETNWHRIKAEIKRIRPLHSSQSDIGRNWGAMTGWAAAILCFAGVFWMIKQNNDLRQDLRHSNTQNSILKETVESNGVEFAEVTSLLNMIRSKDFKAINLPGNVSVSPTAYATVYFNEKTMEAYIDAKGLPVPPEGKVYQVWSLKMDPLTPRSIGLLESFAATESKFFKIENIPTPEAFGITLEPEGGSESPSLDQLYTLGTVTP